ncbi:MAG: PAC2 family protein [Nitrososphaerales archaeon]
MWNRLEAFNEPVLSNDPLLIVSVSTSIPQYRILYSHGRELADYLIEKVDFKLFASLYSSSMPPAVRIAEDGIAELAKVDFYHYSSGKRDYVLFAGYSSPSSDEYEYAAQVLSYAKKIGLKEIVSIGPRWSEQPISPYDSPVVYGFASDLGGAHWLEANGVNLQRNEPTFYFSNLIVGMAPLFGLRGYKLSVNHGEPAPHPKASISFINLLSKMGLEVDTKELVGEARELDDGLRKAGVSGVSEGQVMNDEEDESGLPGGSASGEDIYR